MVEEQRKEIQEYIVEEGDTLFSISQKFGISLETILWANNLDKNSVIKPGQKLIILPVDGILHEVKAGDTLSEIAKKYQAKIEDIISFNELENENDIYIGDILIIPGGKMPLPKPAPQPLAPLAQGYFICPVAGGCRITQGLHWYNAVDFSNGKCGEPILAAAGGSVLKAGWQRKAGNYVKILHPNGVVTMYGHLQTIFVSPGEQVFQGQIIGTMGATGRATGCHLHFDVFGAKNPFAK
jgi:murein DD-endopeptidase MepM/ murein hydrolase activator NlpD